MGDMEEVKGAKVSPSSENVKSSPFPNELKIDESLKSPSDSIVNTKEDGFLSVKSHKNNTPISNDSLEIKLKKETNKNTDLESSDEKASLTEKSEIIEKEEESSGETTLVAVPTIGAPLARSSPISREYLALQKSLNDSKILTEFVADTLAVKTTRKGRKSGLISGNSIGREHPHTKSHRSRLDPLDTSNEERGIGKRSNMRSQNTEFVQRQMDFLSRVMQHQQSGDEQYASEAEESDRYTAGTADDDDERHTNVSNSSAVSSEVALQDFQCLEARLKGIWQPPPKNGWDSFCWRCREGSSASLIPCSKCLRCFHKHCIKVSMTTKLDSSWNCPECLVVENALSSPKKSRRPELTLDMLSELLLFALKRMRTSKGNSKYIFADTDLSSFSKFIANPVTFASLEEKIAKKAYRCPEEFYNETKWMVHNAHILTTGIANSKLVVTAKAVVKVCRQEANEIETCASCYLSANTRSDWFVDVCAQPHLLLWAKLKGFPYWPAKAMGVGQNAVVNVRFFGKHDRAFVPIKDCFLYSEQDPNTQTGKRSARELADCIKEVELHIKKIEAKVGKFNYAPFKTAYDPTEEHRQLEEMMPGVSQYIKRQQALFKPSLQYKIVKTADNNLSIIKKANSGDGGNEDIDPKHDLSDGARKESNKAFTSGCINNDTPKLITSKYEVITKTVSNDSSSSKVSAVILKKRKSFNVVEACQSNSEATEKTGVELETHPAKNTKTVASSPLSANMQRKSGTGTESHLLPSKQPRLESSSGSSDAHGCSQSSCKRKLETEVSSNEVSDSTEKHNVKLPRSEPRLPILTIKAGSAKIVEPSAREVAENFAKSNTCVTIKKIPKVNVENTDIVPTNVNLSGRATRSALKDSAVAVSTENCATKDLITSQAPTSSNTEKNTTNVDKIKLPSQLSTTKGSQVKNGKEKSQNESNTLLELVPFVEIKQEVISDGETDAAALSVPDLIDQENLNMSSNPSGLVSTALSMESQPNRHENVEPALISVKEENIFDDETISANITSFVRVQPDNIESAISDVPNNSTQTVVDVNNIPSATVRVVGDTTIQRVSVKTAASTAANVGQPNSAPLMTPVTTASMNVSASSLNSAPNITTVTQTKRIQSRSCGIPFGPLPASATSALPILPTTNNFKTRASPDSLPTPHQHSMKQQQQQQTQQSQNQRARKSFPNRSPPRVAMSSFPTATAVHAPQKPSDSPPANATTGTEGKRGVSLKSTSMVSIPVDVATQRNIAQNSIPMPPLTAVSKTTPIMTSATNSIAASNSPSSSPNSTASLIGTITPASFANVNSKSVNNQQNSSISTPVSNQVSKMTAPPPLAGLSYSNANVTRLSPALHLSNVPIQSGSNAIIPSPSAEASNSNSTENHLLGDFVTPALANAITEVICRGPPKMSRRPNGPLQSDGSTMFPSEAGPVCRTLVQNAHKLTDFFISVMEDTMCDMSNSDEPSLQAKITLLTIEIERMKQAHEQEIAELKQTSDLMLCEMRKSMENERTRIANEIRKQCELERLRCVDEAKRKQWCANCGREAQFYCCWNTSYCDYPCQQHHWSRHAASCAQTRSSETSSSLTASQPMMSAANPINTQGFNAEVRNKTSMLNPGSMNINIHYNKSVSNSKKEKQATSASLGPIAGINKSSVAPSMASGNSVANDTLKLPSTTYLRPVAPNNITSSSSSSSRSASFNSTGSSRFNLPMTVPAPIHTPYTIVQRGNSWELLTPSSNTAASISAVNTLAGVQPSSSTLASISNAHQQQRSSTMSNISNKGAGRNRVVQSMGYNAPNNNGNMRATKM